MAHWMARAPWSSASNRSSACTAASLAFPVAGVSPPFGHVVTRLLKRGLVVFPRAVDISGALRTEGVLVQSLRVRVLLLFSTDLVACGSQARGLGGRADLVLQVVCTNPPLTLDLAALHQADAWHSLMLCWGSCLARSAWHGLAVYWVTSCPLQPDTFLVAPRALGAYPQLLTSVLSEFYFFVRDLFNRLRRWQPRHRSLIGSLSG